MEEILWCPTKDTDTNTDTDIHQEQTMNQQAKYRHHNIIGTPKVVPMEIVSVRCTNTVCLCAVPGMKLGFYSFFSEQGSSFCQND